MSLWIKDPSIWDKATKTVATTFPGKSVDATWPVTLEVYKKMGGRYDAIAKSLSNPSNRRSMCLSWWGTRIGINLVALAQEDKKIIVVDLDGTLIEYDGYKGPDVFGKPLEGAVEAIKQLRKEGYIVVLYTCRTKTPALLEYLSENGFVFDGINTTRFNPPDTSNKPFGEFYIDDRALTFKGNWKDILNQIHEAKGEVVFTIKIPKIPIEEDVDVWKEAYEETTKICPHSKDSKEFVMEVLKRFKEKGGLDLSVNVGKPPEDIKGKRSGLEL